MSGAWFARSAKGGVFLVGYTLEEARKVKPKAELVQVPQRVVGSAFRVAERFGVICPPWSANQHAWLCKSAELIAGRPRRAVLLLGFTVDEAAAYAQKEGLCATLAQKGEYI